MKYANKQFSAFEILRAQTMGHAELRPMRVRLESYVASPAYAAARGWGLDFTGHLPAYRTNGKCDTAEEVFGLIEMAHDLTSQPA